MSSLLFSCFCSRSDDIAPAAAPVYALLPEIVSRCFRHLCVRAGRTDLHAHATDLIVALRKLRDLDAVWTKKSTRTDVVTIILVDVSSSLKPCDEQAWPLPASSSQSKWFAVLHNRRRCEAELDGGRRADKAPRPECATCGTPASVVGCHQPFHDAVVFKAGTAARGRREDAPTPRPSRRPGADPRVDRKPLLTTTTSYWRVCATFHVALYVLCLICC